MNFKQNFVLLFAIVLIVVSINFSANAELIMRGESFDSDLPGTWTSIGAGAFTGFTFWDVDANWSHGNQGDGGLGQLRASTNNAGGIRAEGDGNIGTIDPDTDRLHFRTRMKVNIGGGDHFIGWVDTNSGYFTGSNQFPDGIFIYQGGGANRIFACYCLNGSLSINEITGADLNTNVREMTLVYDPDDNFSSGSVTLTVNGIGFGTVNLAAGDKTTMGNLTFFGCVQRNGGGGVTDVFMDEWLYTVNVAAVGTASENFDTVPPALWDTAGINTPTGARPNVTVFAGPLAGSTGNEIRVQFDSAGTGRFAADITPVDLDTDVLYASADMFITNTNDNDMTFGWFESTDTSSYGDGIFAGLFGANARIDVCYSLSGSLDNIGFVNDAANQNVSSDIELSYDPTRNGTFAVRYKDGNEDVVGFNILPSGDKTSMPNLDRFGMRQRNIAPTTNFHDVITDNWVFSGTVVPVELSAFSIE